MRKPKPLYLAGYGTGHCLTHDDGRLFVELHTRDLNARQCDRLAAWLVRAAAWQRAVKSK